MAAAQVSPAVFLSHTSPVHPVLQTHVPPAPVQAPLLQLVWEQHLLSKQVPEEHVVETEQVPPSGVSLLQTPAPGELVGLLVGQASQASFAVFGILLDKQLAHTAPEAAYWPVLQATQSVKGVVEVLPAIQLVQEPLSLIDPLLHSHVPPAPVQ